MSTAFTNQLISKYDDLTLFKHLHAVEYKFVCVCVCAAAGLANANPAMAVIWSTALIPPPRGEEREKSGATVDSQFSTRKLTFIARFILASKQVSCARVLALEWKSNEKNEK